MRALSNLSVYSMTSHSVPMDIDMSACGGKGFAAPLSLSVTQTASAPAERDARARVEGRPRNWSECVSACVRLRPHRDERNHHAQELG